MKPGDGKYDCIVLTLVEFAEPCFHVPPNRLDYKIGPRSAKLRLAPKAARAYQRFPRQFVERSDRVASHKRVADVLTFANCADVKAGRKLSFVDMIRTSTSTVGYRFSISALTQLVCHRAS
jgi:hypothetical protein